MKKILLDILFGFIIFISNIYGNSLDDVVIKNNKKTIDFLDSILKDEVYIKFLNTYPDERGEITNFDYKENIIDTIIQWLKSYGEGTAMRFLFHVHHMLEKLYHVVPEEERFSELDRFRFFTFRELHYLYDCILNSQKKCLNYFYSNFIVYMKDLNTRYKLQ